VDIETSEVIDRIGARRDALEASLRAESSSLRAEFRDGLAQNRHHTEVLFESLHDDIRIGIEKPGYVYPCGRRLYGPGVQVGYEYLTRRGLTFVGSLGIGCALGLGGYTSPLQPMVGLGLGYTWSTKQS
jgi:hypothetical protein